MRAFRVIVFGSLAGMLVMPAVGVSQYREGQPNTIIPPPVTTTSPSERASEHEQIEKNFATAYSRAGEPSIAIFWNRKFDDQLSQWYATHRRSITGETGFNAQDQFKKRGDVEREDVLSSTVESLSGSSAEPSGGELGSYERSVKGGSRILASESMEQRDVGQSREGMGEVVDFEFSAGVTQTLIRNRVKVLDREAIVRLVERDNAKETGPEMIVDYQKVETDALIGYADYLAEIVFAPDTATDLGMSFMVSVKEVGTGRVLSMFKSDASVSGDAGTRRIWITTDSGFEQVDAPADYAGPGEIGVQLALDIMQSLSGVL